MTKSILLLTRYGEKGASSRQRHYIYAAALRDAGYSVTCAPLLDDAYVSALYSGQSTDKLQAVRAYLHRIGLLLKARQYDLVWVEKEALPWLPAMIETTLLNGVPYVVDFDDAWHLRYARHPNAWVRQALAKKLERLVAMATMVVCGNENIADWARASGAQRVVILPTVVNTDYYPVRPPDSNSFRKIAWIGTPVTQHFLSIVAEPLRTVQQRHHAQFRAIGLDADFSLPGVTIERVPWSEETEAEELARCDVGIMPLPDDEWSRGKCSYKLIQYMAAARPVVASPVGSNAEVIVHGTHGFLARTSDEWIDALSLLIVDPQRAWEMGRAGRQRVEDLYSLRSAAPKQVQIFEEALARGSKKA